MRLRYAGSCRICGTELPAGTEAIYERPTKTVRCTWHSEGSGLNIVTVSEGFDSEGVAVESGTPGASARREYERRAAKREGRIRSQHPTLGGLILALSEDPQSTRAWDIGAVGEERLGRRLTELTSDALRVLHDRRIPGSRANIDHIVVGPSGVFVVDAKKYKGRPHLKIEGGLLRPRMEKLMVGSRDCTKVVEGVLKQVDVVRGCVSEDVPIHGVLCFVEADWPLIGGSFRIRDVEALWPKKLYAKLGADGPLTVDVIAEVHRHLASALPSA